MKPRIRGFGEERKKKTRTTKKKRGRKQIKIYFPKPNNFFLFFFNACKHSWCPFSLARSNAVIGFGLSSLFVNLIFASAFWANNAIYFAIHFPSQMHQKHGAKNMQ